MLVLFELKLGGNCFIFQGVHQKFKKIAKDPQIKEGWGENTLDVFVNKRMP